MRSYFWRHLVTILAVLVTLSPDMIHPVLAGSPILPDYVFPIPGSTRLNPETSIIVRFPGVVNSQGSFASSFNVTGQFSGSHSGRAVLSDDLSTVVFSPDHGFTPGEAVFISITPDWLTSLYSAKPAPYSFSFQVNPHPTQKINSNLQELNLAVQTTKITSPIQVQSLMPSLQKDLTLPSDFPAYTINTPATPDNQGYYFLAPFQIGIPGPNYMMILDNIGEPVFYQSVPSNDWLLDFKKQPNGKLSYFDSATASFNVVDLNYHNVATYTAKNGYTADLHEFQMLPNNHVVFLIYDPQILDMSQIVQNGNPQAQVVGLVIQELDGSGNVVFEWRSWDHFQITDSDPHIDLTASNIDYVHGNAIQLDWDGNYMISSRHLDEITKIDRRTGNVIWRLGGKNNQFTFTNVDISQSLPFAFQHDIRRLSTGNITLFDNRNNLSPFYSRAVEYSMNEDTKTITQVWEYRSNTLDTFSVAMGDSQRLVNGNTVIGWGYPSTFPTGKQPDVTEVKPDGTKVFEMTFDLIPNLATYISYRAFRFPWQGSPTWPPQINYQVAGDQITLGASWNGATEVSKFEFYGAPAPSGQPVLLGTVTKTGFESQWTFTGNLADYCYFDAVAIDKNNQPMMTSGESTALGCEPFRIQIPIAIH